MANRALDPRMKERIAEVVGFGPKQAERREEYASRPPPARTRAGSCPLEQYEKVEAVRCCGDDLPVAMRDGSRLPVLPGAPTGEELAEWALRRLLRGGTWEALANELAWEAVRSTGCELSCLEWLPGLIEASLSERVDGLEFVLERARVLAWAEHLRAWPHDLAGAETAATLAADEEAAQQVSRLYLDVLEWASGLLSDRLSQAPSSLRPRLRPLRRERPPADLEVPALVADGLTQERPRYGWPNRPSDVGAERSEAA